MCLYGHIAGHCLYVTAGHRTGLRRHRLVAPHLFLPPDCLSLLPRPAGTQQLKSLPSLFLPHHGSLDSIAAPLHNRLSMVQGHVLYKHICLSRRHAMDSVA